MSELERKVKEAGVGMRDAGEVEKDLRRALRAAGRRGDSDEVRRCRLLLGDLLLFSGNVAGAERQFRAVSREEPDSASAMIGIAEVRIGQDRLPEAEELFGKAAELARQRGEPADYLHALDGLAFLASERGDMETCKRLMSKMCDAMAESPRVDTYPLTTLGSFVDDRKGALAIPYLDCVAKRCFQHDQRAWGTVSLRLLVIAYWQSGLGDEGIAQALLPFRQWLTEARIAHLVHASLHDCAVSVRKGDI